tara:strand:- start:77812 stop:78936 length:1125 start_codon:yes stop_codon:yes gene_type:complete
MNWKELRKEFPLVNDKVYLMNASISAQHQSVINQGVKWLENIALKGALLEEDFFNLVVESHDALAQLLKVPRESVTFSPNTGHNMGVIAHILKNRSAKRKVLATKTEFPSSLLPYLHQGYEIDEYSSENGIINYNEFMNQINSDHAAVVLSHVQFQTGQKAPLKEIAKRCKEKEVPFIVNGTQSIGAFDLNLAELDIFAYSASCHKWLGAGLGCAALYINPKEFQVKELPFIGWCSVKEPWQLLNDQPDLREEVNAAQTGTLPFIQLSMVVMAIKQVQRVGINNISARIIELSNDLEESIKNTNCTILSSRDKEDEKTGIINFIHNEVSSETIIEKLRAKNIFINQRRENLRASIHYYNNVEDINLLKEALLQL